MKTYSGFYTTGAGADPSEVTVLVFDKTIHIGYQLPAGQPATVQWEIKDVEVTFSSAAQTTRVRNLKYPPMDVTVNGNDAAKYIRELQGELSKPWYQTIKAKEWGRNALLFLGITTLLVVLYFLIVPWLSGKMASTVSIKTEEQFGNAVYEALSPDNPDDTAASSTINDFFAAMAVTTDYDIRITVAEGETVNAFALPGGRIVVYSALLKQLKTYPELAALLSHEFTHVNNKHSTKSIFRKLGAKIFIGLLFGNVGNVSTVLANHADNLKSLTYSRQLEKEADITGLDLLKQRNIDPKGFEDLFLHLKQSAPASSLPEFLGSHPDIDKRVSYIRASSANAVIKENIQLKSIFEKLKQQIQ